MDDEFDDAEVDDVEEHVAVEEEQPQNVVDLFRELKIQLPSVIVDLYHRDGVWKRDLLLMDLELITVHRREAGAPEPPPLTDEILGELKALEEAEKRRGARAAPAGKRISTPPPPPPLRPVQPEGPPPQRSSVPSAASSRVEEEAEMLTEFVEKFQLQPTRTKLLLARLGPTQRRVVMRNFEPKDSSQGTTSQLEAYIKDNGRSGQNLLTPIGGRPRDRSRSPPREPLVAAPPRGPTSAVPTWRDTTTRPGSSVTNGGSRPSIAPSAAQASTATTSKAKAPGPSRPTSGPTSAPAAKKLVPSLPGRPNGVPESKANGNGSPAASKPKPPEPKKAPEAKAAGTEVKPGGLIGLLFG